MKANLATSLIACARGGVRKQLLVLCLLTLCAGNMWADEITVYVTGEIFIGTGEDAWDNATSTIKVDVRKGHPECFDCDGFNGLYNQDMTNTGYTYNGYPIYSYTFTPTYSGGQFRFKHYKNGGWKEDYTSDWHSTTNQIYQGYYSNAHHWITYGRDVTFYATPEKMDGSKWEEGTHSLFANFKYGDGESEWKRQQMTKTAYTYNGDAIYTCTMLLPYNVITNVQFLYNDGSDHDLYVYTPSPQLTANDVDGKILLGWNGSHNWVSYGRDVTIYTIPDYLFKDKETPFNESTHYPAVCIQMGSGTTWNTESLTKTAYTYESYPIYTGTILIDQNKFWEYQIKYFKRSDNTQVDLYQFNQYEPKTEYAPSYIDDKLYHGWNGSSHDFFPYTYDVKLDQQGGSGGTESIKATDGADLPVATMPGRDGYIFGGYYTEVGGNGDMYYDTNGNSSAQWNSRTITTLYAKWTPKPYTVTLEGMEADSDDPILVNVTYDAVLPSLETKHTKAHYDLLGYWAANDDQGMDKTEQLIDANGKWIPDVAGYTGNDGEGHPTWIRDGINISLFADWTEHPYTVTTSVSPAGAGTLSCGSSVTAKWVTPSEPITANANIGYSFIEWDFSKTGEDNDVYSAEGYTSLSNPIRIMAQHDGTLTAKFTANNYNVNLENLGADEGYKGTENVSVTYNSSANLTENITIPQKEHYDFGGYYASSDEGTTLCVRLIDENGAWIASVDGYTDSDKNWLYADNLTLYAKWTEYPYTVDLKVSPEGAGTIKIGEEIVGSVNAFISTPTDLITATPANPAWKFKGWQYSENVGPADGTGNDNTVQINATRNGTLTAVFEPRYCLVGQLNDGSNEAGGMPGMDDYTVDFDFVSYTGLGEEGVELRCTRSLQPNKQYKFAIHDHVIGRNYGKNSDLDNPTLDAGESWELNTIDHDVLFNTSAAGEYTFKITHMTYGENGDYKCYYPTVEIVYPTAHQLELGWRYTLIDNHDELKVGDTGGTVTATSSGFSIKDKEYIADGEELQLTANANTGYRFDDKWYDNNDCQHSFMSGNPTHATVTSHFRVYAKFAEIPTPITITKIGGGEVQINGEDKESTSVGVTTTRTLTAVAAAGYTFIGWTLPDNADFEMIEGDVDNPTITLRGKGAGTAGEIIANFTECWVLSAESDGWGSAEFTIANITVEDGKAIGYADIALPANTNLQFKVVDNSTSIEYKNGVDKVYYMTYGNSQDWGFGTDKTYNCGITTAGRGSYRFNWNFTDKTMTVEYPESYQVNYGAAVGGSVTSVLDDDGNMVQNGEYVRKGGSVTYEATASDGYTFTGWCSNDSYGNIFTDINPWKNSDITATSNAYAKFHSTNFVIYRTGDKASDPRAVWDDVESYEGGTISETIEFRMKVNELDYWYTLCLPFEVNAVQVWDEVDGAYYDIVPYWRTNGTYYTGHYILRRPVTTTDFAIEGFEGRDRWVDPESNDVLPSKNIPYIIQWHDPYFRDMYISFLGAAGQTIPTAMDKGNYASSDETVNIYGNNSMTTGTVRDAYLLEPDYGPDGAWIREDIGTERSVLPFECFILANEKTTAKYRVLRRDMADDTPTGLDTLSMTEDSVLKVMINNRIYIIRGGKIYTIQGTFVKEVE